MRFKDRDERERYMDSLERQMEHQREQIQRTLDQTKGSGRLRTALEKLRSTFPSFPGRTSVRDVGERGAATERTDSEAPRSSGDKAAPSEIPTKAGGGRKTGSEPPWWTFWR